MHTDRNMKEPQEWSMHTLMGLIIKNVAKTVPQQAAKMFIDEIEKDIEGRLIITRNTESDGLARLLKRKRKLGEYINWNKRYRPWCVRKAGRSFLIVDLLYK